MSKKQVEITTSDFIENFFYLKGQPLSLKDYPHMRAILNSDADKLVMKFSRQTTKSSTLANWILARAYMTPELRQLYTSPAVAQTQEFARDKLEPLINTSPLSAQYVDSAQVQNVLKKEFKNGSVINLRYALLNADRIRGISADINYFDECFDPSMELLTASGWVTAKQAAENYEVYSFATIAPNGTIEYQKAQRGISKKHTGDFYTFSNGLKITPNHNLFSNGHLEPAYNALKYKSKHYFHYSPQRRTTTSADYIAAYEMLRRDNKAGVVEYIFDDLDEANAMRSAMFFNARATTLTYEDNGTYIVTIEPNKENITDPQISQVIDKDVYCVTVPNKTLIVRPNDTDRWIITGNCQDLRKDVIGVIEETMSRSEIKKTVYAGTPKRSKGTLADLWFGSTQNEYAIKSSASGH